MSSTTFVEKKDALKILFQLWNDFLNLELLQYFPLKGFYEYTKPADFKAFGDKTTKWI
ncbi:hypothetical protein HanRHA438_Chr03g0145171 [Helianthus annuus]|nr:hypothetical protein HanIR_Chr03g0145331 [Helianthus annuus]KAJ0937720.1 hypothetical protein HanRHA438_Chr03g0145171 [Helianthus annuus]KAJ0945680.1 hypothetical protein HanPSC8_Chr03g0130881 [Helianthus annuus]